MTPPPTSPDSERPRGGAALYVVPDNPASRAVANAPALQAISTRATTLWATEQTNLDLLPRYAGDAASKGQIPTFVLYAIPGRDCGKFSAGGFATAAQYRQFVDRFKTGLADRRAILILEPDALPELSVCNLSAAQQEQRLALVRYAAETLSSQNVRVYLEGGGAYSNPVSTIAPRLKAAGIASAAGFALNVSAFDTTARETAYGRELSAALGGKHFVIDTSRNGVGVPKGTPAGAFCNVPGLALGEPPSTKTSDPLLDAYLWVKYPGESDGACNGAPYSGTFMPEYALGLVARSPF